MNTQTCNTAITDELFLVLSEKEKNIISKRFSLLSKERKTLEQIGQEYNITRERVRQIEKNAITKLRRTSAQTKLSDVFEATKEIVTQNGGIVSEYKLLDLVSGLIRKENFSNELLVLSFEINPLLGKIKKSKMYTKSWYIKDKVSKKEIIKINTLAEKELKKEGEIVEESEFLSNLQEIIKSELKINATKSLLISALEIGKKVKKIREGFGLTQWRSVQPKSIKDKALIVLKRKNAPMHFRKIADEIANTEFDKKNVTIQAVHNELIRYNEFVLIGRGIYALKEWGFSEGTVKDVIKDVLKSSGPLNKSEIIQEVLKRRQVKTGTISLNLQKYPEFKRVGRAVYTLA
jgi:hypothetical protein